MTISRNMSDSRTYLLAYRGQHALDVLAAARCREEGMKQPGAVAVGVPGAADSAAFFDGTEERSQSFGAKWSRQTWQRAQRSQEAMACDEGELSVGAVKGPEFGGRGPFFGRSNRPSERACAIASSSGGYIRVGSTKRGSL